MKNTLKIFRLQPSHSLRNVIQQYVSHILLRKDFSNFVFACVQNRVVINICFLGNNVASCCRSPVKCLVAEVWPTLQVKTDEKKTTQSSVKRKRRLAHLPRVPHCAFDCPLLLIRPNNTCCVGYTYWRCMHHCLMLGVVARLHLFLVKNCKVFEPNSRFYHPRRPRGS